jgi:hypothetical protein
MTRRHFQRALRALIGQLAALVILAGAVGVILITMAFEEPPPLVLGRWEPSAGRPWDWPAEPLAPLEVSLGAGAHPQAGYEPKDEN